MDLISFFPHIYHRKKAINKSITYFIAIKKLLTAVPKIDSLQTSSYKESTNKGTFYGI